MKRNWIRTIIGGISFTSALFVFQACYGTPQDFENDLLIEGQVKAKSTGLPIKGIKVSIANSQNQITDEEGRFGMYYEKTNGLAVRFEDVDSVLNGKFQARDTILANLTDRVYLDIVLDEVK
jgi:hypothetical protein